jgi:hypothetical protein
VDLRFVQVQVRYSNRDLNRDSNRDSNRGGLPALAVGDAPGSPRAVCLGPFAPPPDSPAYPGPANPAHAGRGNHSCPPACPPAASAPPPAAAATPTPKSTRNNAPSAARPPRSAPSVFQVKLTAGKDIRRKAFKDILVTYGNMLSVPEQGQVHACHRLPAGVSRVPVVWAWDCTPSLCSCPKTGKDMQDALLRQGCCAASA